jgi:hypothetical protein
MMLEGKDATWLFEKYERSEQWWTSFASMLFTHLALKDSTRSIPIWRYETDQKGWRFNKTHNFLTLTDIRPSHVMVEKTLKGDLFQDLPSWPTELITTPDLLLYWKVSLRTVIIENKTKGAQAGSISKYCEAKKYLKDHGWETDFILLISCGHPDNSIWNLVEEYQLNLLLWEDLLRLADSLDWSRSLFEEDLKGYYERPALQGSWRRGR